MIICRGISLGHDEARRATTGSAARSAHVHRGFRLMQQLLPKWGGSWEQVSGFAAELLRPSRPGPRTAAGRSPRIWSAQAADTDAEGAAYLREPGRHRGDPPSPTGRSGTRVPGRLPVYTAHDYFAMLFSFGRRRGRGPAFPGPRRAAAAFWDWYFGDAGTAYARHRAARSAGLPPCSGRPRSTASPPCSRRARARCAPADLPGRPGRRGARPPGITHLVEHLALHRHGSPTTTTTAPPAAVVTRFHMQGGEGDVVPSSRVCDSLADLPMERLESEKQILRTEAAGRRSGVNRQAAAWRYGARASAWSATPSGGRPARPGRRAPLGDAPGSPGRTRCCGSPAPAPGRACGCACPRGTPAGAAGRSALPAPRRTSPAAAASCSTAPPRHRGRRCSRGCSSASCSARCARRAAYLHRQRRLRPARRRLRDLTAFADALPEKQDAVLGGFVDAWPGSGSAGSNRPTSTRYGRSGRGPAPPRRSPGGCRAATNLLTGEPARPWTSCAPSWTR